MKGSNRVSLHHNNKRNAGALNWIAMLCVALMAAGMVSCGFHKGVTASGRGYTKTSVNKSRPETKPVAPPPIPSDLTASSRRLLQQAYGWLGTPYAYGGTDRKGVDCSGLVMNVYNDALSIKLPRSSAQQQQYCQPIDMKDISPGDLLFFSPSGKGIGHVGLYIGSGSMIHASSSGVVVTPLESQWVKKRFHSAGRVASYWATVTDETERDKRNKKLAAASGKKKNGKKSRPAPRAIESMASDSIAIAAFFE